MSESHSPFDQFIVKPIVNLSLSGYDISFTNSSLFMTLSIFSLALFFTIATWNASLVPTRLQSLAEILYEFIEDTMLESAGPESRKYFPIIFTIFLFVIICNLFGMIPYGFAVTSHIIVTFVMAIIIFMSVTIIAIAKHGAKFFSFFLPEGTPWWLAPLMIVIELFAYLSRPVSLSIRLAANMIAGHVLLKVLGGFVVMLGLVWGFIPIPLIMTITAFEIFVAMLQAYIFTILTCVYLGDALQLH